MFLNPPVRIAVLFVLAWLMAAGRADVPATINYQGRVTVEGVNFDSATAGHAGTFRFALVSGDGATTYWSNDGTSVAGSEPVAGVQLAVIKGLYSVMLGDSTSPLNMQPITPSVFATADVRLRIWFDDGTHGSQLLAPDQPIASVAFAMIAQRVPDGAITGAQLAPESVHGANIALGAVGNAQLANSGITIDTGIGLAGGGTVALGGTIVLGNTGVTAIEGGGGITVTASTGAITLGSNATDSNTPGSLVLRDALGGFSAGTITGDLAGNAATATLAVNANSFLGALAGDVTGTQGATVVAGVGGISAANIAISVGFVSAATDLNTPGTLVLRGANGDFRVGTITGNLAGNAATATLAVSANDFLGALAGDVVGTQGATLVEKIGGLAPASISIPGSVVKRDANGNFSAANITANSFIGNGTGITGVPGTLPWLTVTGNAQQAVSNTGYLATDAALVTVTLPTTAAVGDIVRVSGVGAGGWLIAPNAGQSIVGFGAGLGITGTQGTGAGVQYVGDDQWLPIKDAIIGGTEPEGVISITAGNGLAGGGFVPLGGAILLENVGVITLSGGGGITVSGSTGAVTLGSNATSLNTPSTLVLRDANGDFAAGNITANLAGNAATATLAVNANSFLGALAGDVTGTQGATVVAGVGGISAANIATGLGIVGAATDSNVPGRLVLRDANGDFSVGTITGNLNGNATSATTAASATVFTGALLGDVTGTQSATVVEKIGGLAPASIATPGAVVKRDANGAFSAANITADSFTGNGAGLTGVPGTLPWLTVNGNAQQAISNTGYLATDAALVTITLPATATVGDIVRVSGAGGGGWALVPNVGQTVIGFGAGVGISGSQGTGAGVQYVGDDQWLPMKEVVIGGTEPEGVISITAGNGLAGGGIVPLGGAISLENVGVITLSGGGGITVSGSTGAITLGSNATELNTPSTLVLRDASGNFTAGTITANLDGNATSATMAATAISALSSTNFTGVLLGDVTGTQGATHVASVGGVSATGIATAAILANFATASGTPGTLVRRDGSGRFSGSTISATQFVGGGAGLTGVAGTLPWRTVTGTSQQAEANAGYLATDAALVTITLPAIATAGDIVRVSGVGAGGWVIVPSAGQSVVGFGAGLGPAGSQGAGGAVQFVGNDSWQPMSESQISPGAVQAAHIASGAVDNSRLANPSITINTGVGLAGGGLLPLGGSLTLSIPEGGIGSAQLAPSAVQSAHIAPGALLENLLGSGDFDVIIGSVTDQWLGVDSMPTFAGAFLSEPGTGSAKPALVLDRGIGPKGRLTFQRSSEDASWSGLVLSVNADWNDVTGYAADDGDRSQSIFQMEYEYASPLGLLNEMNWTSAGRRIWFSWGNATDYTKASVQWLAPSKILVPAYDSTGEPALQIEDHKGGSAAGTGDGTQLVIQNSNSNPDTSSAAMIRFVGLATSVNAPTGTDWYIGTDLATSGSNNFSIRDGKNGGTRLFIDGSGNVGIGGNTAPAAKLDVNGGVNVAGTVNATNFTVNGGPIPNLAKLSVSRYAAELRNYFGAADTVANYILTPSSRVADGASIIKLMSLSPDQWRGKTVKLQMIVGVNGGSGGNLAARLAIAYRNTALDGTNGSDYNAGDSDGSLNNTTTVVAAPAAANKLLLIESPAMTIPADVTALSANFGFERTPANGDTNTDAAFIVECRVVEQ